MTILGDLLTGETKDLGIPQMPQVLVGAISAVIAYSCLTDTSYVTPYDVEYHCKCHMQLLLHDRCLSKNPGGPASHEN